MTLLNVSFWELHNQTALFLFKVYANLIGFLVSVEIQIIPSKRFVKLDYQPVYSLDQMIEKFEKEVERVDTEDFVECLVFSKDRAVVMTGNPLF